MSLGARIKEPVAPPASGLPCSIKHLLETLEESEAQALHAMLYDLGWNAGQIYDALRDEGHTVGRQSINRHRGGRCRCARLKP